MIHRSLLYPATVLMLVAAPLAGQQPTQQARPDSASVVGAVPPMVAQAQADATLAGSRVDTGGYAVGGFFTGLVTGIIGVWIARSIAGSGKIDVPPDARLAIASQPAAYQQAYQTSYAARVKAKRKSSMLRGGLIGVATFASLYIAGGGFSSR